MFGDFSLFFSLPHSKDKDFANAPETSHGVKIAPHHDRVVMRSYTCDLILAVSHLAEVAWYVVFSSCIHLCLTKAYLKTPKEVSWNRDPTLERKTKCIQQMHNQDPPQDKMKVLYLAWMVYYNKKLRSKGKLIKKVLIAFRININTLELWHWISLYSSNNNHTFLLKKSELKSCPVTNGGTSVSWRDPESLLLQPIKKNPDDSCKQPAVTEERIQTGPPRLTKLWPTRCRQYLNLLAILHS